MAREQYTFVPSSTQLFGTLEYSIKYNNFALSLLFLRKKIDPPLKNFHNRINSKMCLLRRILKQKNIYPTVLLLTVLFGFWLLKRKCGWYNSQQMLTSIFNLIRTCFPRSFLHLSRVLMFLQGRLGLSLKCYCSEYTTPWLVVAPQN